MLVGLDLRQPGAHATWTSTLPRARLRVGQLDGALHRLSTAVCSTSSRIGRTKSSTSCTIAFAIFGFADDVGQHGLRVGASVILRRSRPAITSMPASGFFTSWAMAAAISPTRRQAVAQPLAFLELLDPREVPEEHRRADDRAVVVADQRERVADHLARRLDPHLDAVRQMMQIEGARQHADDVRMIVQDVRQRLTEIVGARVDAEDPVGLVVDERQPPVAGDRQHAVAHARHDVPEEGVIDAACMMRPRDVTCRFGTIRHSGLCARTLLRRRSVSRTSVHVRRVPQLHH